mgnify:CR=1 FL=1
MTIREIQAIDVHAHYGDYIRADATVRSNGFLSADAATVVRRATQCNTEITVVSPLSGLLPRGGSDAGRGNEEAARIVPETPGLRQWVIIDPSRPATFAQAARMLQLPHCVGIKIHPEEHVYHIRDHGRAIFDFAATHDAVVLTHSGEQNSLPADYLPFADEFPEVTLILAHIGCGFDGDRTHQVRAVSRSRHGNIYADTSSIFSMLPRLIEWAVAEVGADRVLYGTDTPLYLAAMQRARIDNAELSDEAKRTILRDNAERILDLQLG